MVEFINNIMFPYVIDSYCKYVLKNNNTVCKRLLNVVAGIVVMPIGYITYVIQLAFAGVILPINYIING